MTSLNSLPPWSPSSKAETNKFNTKTANVDDFEQMITQLRQESLSNAIEVEVVSGPFESERKPVYSFRFCVLLD